MIFKRLTRLRLQLSFAFFLKTFSDSPMDLTKALQIFSIRQRMFGAVASTLFFLALIGGAGLWSLTRVEAIDRKFAAQTQADTATLIELRTAIGTARRFEKDLVINYDSVERQAVYRLQWNKAVESARLHAHRLADPKNPTQMASAQKIDTLVKSYAEKATLVFKQIEVLGFNDAPVANLALGSAKDAVHSAESEIIALAALLDTEAVHSVEARITAIREAYLLFGAVILIAIGAVVPVSLLNMLSICRPINRARAIAQRIAAGDLTEVIVVVGRDETSQLLGALASMQHSLRDMVGQLQASTDSISTASAEIAIGNQDLANRNELAATNVQQAAASLEQLTGAVKQSAESAHQANQLASSAVEVAARGGVAVSQVVATMDDINTASKRIADIIGVIDGIAFQTNLLALNAAIEAARAGEHGRGFAVVASEVRSLAQRSAEAAKEIKGLIGASVDKVQGGSRLVADAGRTMTEIVSSVQRVSQIIGEITTAAAEQSDGIGQINIAVNLLDHMTQQNAALVEESAAAAQSLNDQAGSLAQVVGRFKLGIPVQVAGGGGGFGGDFVDASAVDRGTPDLSSTRLRSPVLTPSIGHKTPQPRSQQLAAAGAHDGDWETF